MAQIGEKIYDVGSQQFQQLNEQINDANNGIAGRVNQLEASADVSNVNPYDPDRAYQAGNMAIVGGRLKRANKATTGVLVEADWEDPSPTATVTANRAVVSDNTGKLVPSAVTDVELAQIRGGAAIQDDDIIDDGAFLHNASGTMKQTGFNALWRWIASKVTGAASTILTDNVTADKVLVSDGNGKVSPSVLSYSATLIEPETANSVDLGSATKYFQSGHFQYVNFMSAEGVNEGNVDADAGSLGLFGTTELALGYGNNNKDLTFTSTGLTLSKDMTLIQGTNVKFQDADSSGKEGVNLRMNGNNLGFFGVLNGVEDTTPIAQLTYDGKFSARNVTGSAAGTASATSTTYVTVCELGSIRLEINNSGGRIVVTDGVTHRFDWVRMEGGASTTSGTGTASSNFALAPPSSDGLVRSLTIGVSGTFDGVISVVIRKVSATQLTMTASMVLSG
ncbi:TPA: hypothetical protein RUZ17_002927 [Vibrio cholerae]|nr:hypothetical protein [Vibrio cholerae]